MKEFVEYELACLWSDLEQAERDSLSSDPAVPSMAMEWIIGRIRMATELVGPVDWRSISTEWLMNGQYQYWAKYMGIEYDLPTEEELSEVKAVLREVGWDENL